MMQYVAVCSSVLSSSVSHVAARAEAARLDVCFAVCSSVMRCVAALCTVLQCGVVCYLWRRARWPRDLPILCDSDSMASLVEDARDTVLFVCERERARERVCVCVCV